MFCTACIIETDHEHNRIKIHYENWGSSYDEWFVYLAETVTDNDNNDGVILSQQDMNYRIAQYGLITNRNIKQEYFKKKVERFDDKSYLNESSENKINEIKVNLPIWFWKKNEDSISNKELYVNKWLNAKIVGYKTSTKYSHHIKIGIHIGDAHYAQKTSVIAANGSQRK